MRNAANRLIPPSLLPSESDPSPRYWIGFLAVLALVGAFAWWRPGEYGPAALALAAALVVDLAARLAVVTAARRSGLEGPVRGLPSLVLLVGSPVGIALIAILGILVLGPDRFPILASLLAGIATMNAVARLAAARSLLVAKNQADDE